jgi:hypothetical protein
MIKIGIASFREHEFDRIRNFVPDGDKFEETWAGQQIKLEEALSKFRSQGMVTVPVTLTLAALVKYEVDHGVRPDGEKRAQMASELVWK